MPARKNHFFFSYFGNKRNEIDNIFNSIKNFDVEYIVEPFCGSSAFSYHMSIKHPGRYTYILNDNNKPLIELYNIMTDEKKLDELEQKVNSICAVMDGSIYAKLDIKTIEGYYIKNKIYNIRPGLWKTGYKYKPIKLNDAPILNFLKNEKVIFSTIGGIDIYEQYKNKNAIIFLDPPYIMSCNTYYQTPELNIYEHLYHHDICTPPAEVIFCLESIWLIKLLFRKYKFIAYDKVYQARKKKTTHVIINNKEPINSD